MTDPQIKVTYLNHMGDDLTTVNAARVSFNKTSDWETSCALCGLSGADVSACVRSHMGQGDSIPCTLDHLSVRDQRLIEYLGRHGHDSPFNHNALSVHVKMPIFVARQLVKHEYLVLNEISRRYVDSDPEFYVPDRWRLAAENVKQGSSDRAMEIDRAFKNPNGNTKNSRRSPSKVKYSNWKARAGREGKEFTVTVDDIPWVTHCPILGIELDWTLCHGKGIQKNSPTLDRIDNTQGYVPGNVMVISSLANTMKSFATPEELKTFSRSMLVQYGGVFTDQSRSVSGFYDEMRDLYRRLIDSGLCAEQARMFMPQAMMTEWHWSGLLSAWAKMVNQRIQPDTQYETRLVAQQVDKIASNLWPHSWKALRSMNL